MGKTGGFVSLLYLVRHGQASFFAEDYDRLSPLGELQARRLGEFFAARGVRFDAAYSGPAGPTAADGGNHRRDDGRARLPLSSPA